MKKDIFRKVALDRLSSPEEIDYLVETTGARAWTALLALCFIMAVAIVWGFLGSIDTTAPGQGAIVRHGGVYNVVTMAAGRVTELNVKVGDFVKADQIIARVSQPALEEKLQAAREELLGAKKAHQRSLEARTKADEVNQVTASRQRAALEMQIRNTKDQIQLAKDQIPIDEQLLAKGLITKQASIQNFQKVAQLEGDITRLQAQISQIESEQVATRNQKDEATTEFANRLDALTWNVRSLEQELKRSSNVVAAKSGRVVEMKVALGAIAGAGVPIIAIESAERVLEALVYVAAGGVKEIRPGMDAQISPSGVQREEYGYLLGKVETVGEFPATAEAIISTFQNETFAQSLLNGGPVTEVRIQFISDPSTRSKLKWSSRKEPPTAVSSGSVCTVQVVTRRQRPIDLVIPYLRKQMGI
jgi:HlyD family secretion protein